MTSFSITFRRINMSKQYMPSKALLFLCCMIVASIFLVRTSIAQPAPTTISTDAGVANAFSPSITSFMIGSQENLVCAYTFKNSATTRTVGISRSADGGGHWSRNTNGGTTITLPTLKWDPADNSSETLLNMDEAQVISIGGDNLVLVVRAWSSTAANIKGQEAYQEQPGTIYVKSGIYLCLSLDRGQTWGYWGTGSTPESKWLCIDRNTNYTATDQFTTLEYPRIAFRGGYDNKGYVTWNKKIFKTLTNLLGVDGYKIPYGEDGETTPGILMGIAVFNGTNTSDPSVRIGSVYFSDGGGSSFARYFSNDFSTSGYDGTSWDHTYPNTSPGRERPSVAIAPDKRVWLAWYEASYYDYVDGDCDDNDMVWAGNRSPLAYFLIGSTDCNIGVNGTIHYASFSNKYAQVIDQKAIPGYWDNKRGYCYLKDFNNSYYDNSNCINNTDTYNPIPFSTNTDFDFDAAQGPSIQIVSDQPLTCTPSYRVGYLYVYGNRNTGGFDFAQPPIPTTTLAFYSAGIPGDKVFANTPQDNPALYSVNNRYPTTGSDPVEPTDNSGTQHFRFFPVLKYANVQDVVLMQKPTDGSTSFMPSYFALSYISATRNSTNTGSHFEHAKNVTALSVDGKSFSLNDYANTPVSHSLLRDAEDGTIGCGDVSTSNWGCKIDVCGESGNFTIHPIWHDIIPLSDHLLTNIGNGILVKPYLTPSFPNDPNALPNAGFLNINVLGGTPIFIYGPYAYFDFNDIGRPISDNTIPQISIKAITNYTDNINSTGTYTFDDFYPQNTIPLPTNPTNTSGPMPNGLYYAKYNNNNSTSQQYFGVLGWSSQRKIVTTGKIAHAVCETLEGIWYTMNLGTPPLSNELPNWWNRILLNSTSYSNGIYNTSPSIAVYEQGDQSGFTGKAAIAVTWTEYEVLGDPNAVVPYYRFKILFKTREFDVCNAKWGDWSPNYTVYEFVNRKLHDYTVYDPESRWEWASPPVAMPHFFDPPIPVVAPIVTQVAGGDPLKTNLLGWTVTWNQDALAGKYDNYDFANVCFQDLCSRSWMRVNNDITSSDYHKIITDNSYWGEFYSVTNAAAKWQPSAGFNYLLQPPVVGERNFGTDWFHNPTVVCMENKFITEDIGDQYIGGRNGVTNNMYGQAVAFSDLGDIFTENFAYSRDLSANDNIGSLIPGSPIPVKLTPSSWQTSQCDLQLNANPCITMNSSGQLFVSWDRVDGDQCKNFYTSSVVVQNSFSGGNWTNANGLLLPKQMYSAPCTSINDEYIRNGSITGTPKSRLKNVHYDFTNHIGDEDLGGVELGFWQQNAINQNGVNKIWPRHYQETPGVEGTGQWDVVASDYLPANGRWSQRSFGVFNEGYHNFQGHSYFLGNDPLTDYLISVESAGSYKGTYDQQLPYELYRDEYRSEDCAGVRFVWGSVYVSDSTSHRQVMLYNGQDSSGYSSHDAERDSLFRTASFTVLAGDTITFWRAAYHTCCYCADSVFARTPFFQMGYSIELVHQNGQVDTLEKLNFCPGTGNYIDPRTIHTTPSPITEDVYIRVRGHMNGMSDADSLCEFDVESMFGSYASNGDSIVALKSVGGIIENPSALNVKMPYPNPVLKQNGNINIMVAYPTGHTVQMQVLDVLGRECANEKDVNSAGDWQTVPITVPKTVGTYYLRVTAGNETKLFPLIVTE